MGTSCCIPDQVNRHDIRDIRKSSWNSGRNGRDGIGRSKVDIRELKAFRDRLDKAAKQTELSAFYEQAAKELAARLLALVKKRTPVGKVPTFDEPKTVKYKVRSSQTVRKKAANGYVEYQRQVMRNRSFFTRSGYILAKYWSGYVGGTLRKGWTTTEVRKVDGGYQIEVINPTEYASYVEFGHRQKRGRYVPALGKALSKTWVKGRFMLTISEQELEAMAPRILEKKLQKFLEGVVTGSDQ